MPMHGPLVYSEDIPGTRTELLWRTCGRRTCSCLAVRTSPVWPESVALGGALEHNWRPGHLGPLTAIQPHLYSCAPTQTHHQHGAGPGCHQLPVGLQHGLDVSQRCDQVGSIGMLAITEMMEIVLMRKWEVTAAATLKCQINIDY